MRDEKDHNREFLEIRIKSRDQEEHIFKRDRFGFATPEHVGEDIEFHRNQIVKYCHADSMASSIFVPRSRLVEDIATPLNPAMQGCTLNGE